MRATKPDIHAQKSHQLLLSGPGGFFVNSCVA